jgi:hypothetical protein
MEQPLYDKQLHDEIVQIFRQPMTCPNCGEKYKPVVKKVDQKRDASESNNLYSITLDIPHVCNSK